MSQVNDEKLYTDEVAFYDNGLPHRKTVRVFFWSRDQICR